MNPTTSFDLDAPLSDYARVHGTPEWHHLAASQRWWDGRILCALCGRDWPQHLESELEWDHIVPTSKGGADSLRNSQLTCPSCNAGKGDRTNAEAIEAIAAMRGLTRLERRLKQERDRQGRPENRAKNRERKRTPEYRKQARERQRRPEVRAQAREYERRKRIRHRGNRFGKPGGNARLL